MRFAFPARLVEGEGVATITAFNANSSRGFYTADARHPHFAAIVKGLEEGDENVWEMFDVAQGVMRRFQAITDRVSYDGESVLWDGDPVHSVLADQLRRALESGEDNYEALARFWERLESNPNSDSREQAYNWLATHDFKITPEGMVVGYKGVVRSENYPDGTPVEDGVFLSSAASRVPDVPSGYVNGEPVPPLRQIPQKVGDVVTMPRSEVKHDPHKTCDRGLHVGDWSYASTFARGAVFEVHFDPRDIVSVPVDEGFRKVRVSRYKVVAVVESEHSGGPVLKPGDVSETWEADVSYRA